MNNQAAQTMPELPEPRMRELNPYHGSGIDPYDGATHLQWYNAAQMHQYARDYAAALSQTAGVADIGPGVRGDMARAWLAVTETLDQVFPQWIESDKTGRDCACDAIRFLAERSRIAAAPAASGWNITDHSHEIGFDDGLDGPAASGGEDDPYAFSESRRRHEAACRDRMNVSGVFNAEPPSAASVSERAALLAIIAEGIRNAERHPRQHYGLNLSTLRALEQALTQQRGECEAVDRDAWAEALELPQGYTVEEFLPGGWHYAWTRADGERMVSGTTWNHPALAAIAAWQYAPATTPQPGAEALRELVQRWRNEFGEFHEAKLDCADELESLLARGG